MSGGVGCIGSKARERRGYIKAVACRCMICRIDGEV